MTSKIDITLNVPNQRRDVNQVLFRWLTFSYKTDKVMFLLLQALYSLEHVLTLAKSSKSFFFQIADPSNLIFPYSKSLFQNNL